MTSPPTRAPFIIAGAVAAEAVLVTVGLGVDPEPFAPAPALVLGTDLILLALVAAAGLLLPRGRWARALAGLVALAGLGIAAARPFDGWTMAAVAWGAVALAGLTGPWLSGWLRRLPAADGPPPSAVALILLSLAGPGLVAAASPGGLAAPAWSITGLGPLLGWGFARAVPAALWALRLLPIPLAIWAAATGAAAIAIGCWALGITALAWRPEVRRAVFPLYDRLPGPRHRAPLDRRP